MSKSDPATHPELLKALAADFSAHGYDIRHTLRLIATSTDLCSGWSHLPRTEWTIGSIRTRSTRPLPAEVLADALADVTGVSDRYGDLPEGTRTIALPDSHIPAESLDILGRCSRDALASRSPPAEVGSPPHFTGLMAHSGLKRKLSRSAECRLAQFLGRRVERNGRLLKSFIFVLSVGRPRFRNGPS